MTLPRKPRAVAIDLDGTLIDSEALVRETYGAVASATGLSMSDEQFLSLVGLHREANDAQLLTFYGADFPLKAFHEAARSYVSGRVAPLKPGVTELLDALDELALPRALVTSSGHAWVHKHFAAHGLSARIATVVTRNDCVNGKPDPEPYLKATAALGVAPELALALEDSHVGVRSAHAAGLMTVMVPDLLEADEEMRSKAACVVGTLHEIVEMLSMNVPQSDRSASAS
jgi:HAD superfamily hydrolase (TIGR01509 family)